MLSRRTRWDATRNAFAMAREAALARGRELLDLTVSNPTLAGIAYPSEELADILARAARVPYRPDPVGIFAAREALAAELSTMDDPVDPDHLVLTASTSEAYAWLFKLLANPDDEIVTHTPSYPLLDHLADLESVRIRRFPLHFHAGRWEVETSSVAAALGERTRAVVMIHPNNPTGSFVGAKAQLELAPLLADREVPLIADEVFFDYPFEGATRPPSLASLRDVPTFVLGGLSKSAGLPHWKLGWIRLAGPPDRVAEAKSGLELIADTFLSVSTPVQAALPEVLAVGRGIRDSIRRRTAENLATLSSEARRSPAIELLPADGGWTAVLRLPLLGSEEEMAIEFLERDGVVVQPGWLFDFAMEGFFVVSLITEPEVFAEGVQRVVERVMQRVG